MFRNTDKMMVIISVIIMLLANNVEAKDNEFNFKSNLKIVAGIATFHPFGDGKYDSLSKETYQWNGKEYSYKYVEDKKYNNDTDFIGIEYKDILLGTFKNSYYNRSYILAFKVINKSLFKYDKHKINLTSRIGITHGYRVGKDLPEKICFGNDVCPSISFGFEYSYKNEYFLNTSFVSNSININVAKAISIK